MSQFLTIAISFLPIPILVRRRIKLSTTLLIVSIALAVFSGLGLSYIVKSTLNLFNNINTRDTIFTVFMISILGDLMKSYGILDNIIEIMFNMVRSKKAILMIFPALIGLLVIPGGAILSSPFIYQLGEELELPKERRAAINLAFRHVGAAILPFSSALLLIAATIPEINIYIVILLNFILIIGNMVIGYILFIRDIDTGSAEEASRHRQGLIKNLGKLLILTSPIYIPVIVNLITRQPFYISMLTSFAIIYLLSDKRRFLQRTFEGINWDVVISVILILLIKDLILGMKDMLELVNMFFNSSNNQIITLGIFLVISVFFGLITGNSSVPLAITLPILMFMDLGRSQLYIHIFYLYGTAFLGYFFSPIHLCQVFTLSQMDVTMGDLYREYRIYFLSLVLLLIITTSGLLFIF